MSSDLAISVRGLTKEYRIAHNAERHNRVTDAAASAIKGLFRKQGYETFRALDDVSFDVRKGDVLGIIGRNGAGKSTLLKVLSRITEPTAGEIRLYGRVGSLLEVGTGFHPELTGRENVYLNGAILGMRRREIDRQFDAIVDFAEVERFLDTPVKRYSSGMYVRLAFAVAAHLNPEILIVDEVLAVGDAQFQQKCLGKMQDVSRQDGRTVLFVSHNMGVVQALCQQAVLLDNGRAAMFGEVEKVVDSYNRVSLRPSTVIPLLDKDGVQLTGIVMNGQSNPPFQIPFLGSLDLEFQFYSPRTTPRIIPFIRWKNRQSLVLSEIWGPEEGVDFSCYEGSFSYHLKWDRVSLVPGSYSADILLHDMSGKSVYSLENGLQMEVLPTCLPNAPRAYDSKHGLFRMASSFRRQCSEKVGIEG